jgi:integrase
VDAVSGALHESAHRVWEGPPKTAASARWIALPPFLVGLLRQHLAGHDSPMVFPTRAGSWQRRSSFSRQVMRPAADGTDGMNSRVNTRAARARLAAVKPGLVFHGLRHSHHAWLIEDGVSEIVRAHRLGHALATGIHQWHVHAGPGQEQQMLDRLQARFIAAEQSASTQVRAFLAAAKRDPVRQRHDAA